MAAPLADLLLPQSVVDYLRLQPFGRCGQAICLLPERLVLVPQLAKLGLNARGLRQGRHLQLHPLRGRVAVSSAPADPLQRRVLPPQVVQLALETGLLLERCASHVLTALG